MGARSPNNDEEANVTLGSLMSEEMCANYKREEGKKHNVKLDGSHLNVQESDKVPKPRKLIALWMRWLTFNSSV